MAAMCGITDACFIRFVLLVGSALAQSFGGVLFRSVEYNPLTRQIGDQPYKHDSVIFLGLYSSGHLLLQSLSDGKDQHFVAVRLIYTVDFLR